VTSTLATGRARKAHAVRLDTATEAAMSHDLFHDVTERRPRASRATGGTLAVSIAAHAVILTAVIVVPLLATDTLPMPAEVVDAFVRDAPPPPPPPPPLGTRTPVTKAPQVSDAAPVAPLDRITPEIPRQPITDYSMRVAGPTGDGVPDGVADSIAIGTPQPPPPQPPPPAQQKPVRLSAVDMPRKIHDVSPVYPQLALRANVEGVVIVEAVIAVDGSVRDARVLRSVALLDRAALDAVRQWRYAPTRLNGVAVPVIVTVTVQFRLQR
jgi:protein TonB